MGTTLADMIAMEAETTAISTQGTDPLATQARRVSLSVVHWDTDGSDHPATPVVANAQPATNEAAKGQSADGERCGAIIHDHGYVIGEVADMGSAPESIVPYRRLPVSNNHPMSPSSLEYLPNEVLLDVLGFLDVYDLLSTSRVSHLLRTLSLAPILQHHRLRRTRLLLPPLLSSPHRPSLANLIARHIFLTHTSIISRRLGRSLVSIRLSHRLAARPSAECLVQRAVLPQECVPGMAVPVHVSPAIVARRRAIERERLKDGLRRWVEGKWRGEVRQRAMVVKRWEESRGVGRVWRLRRFWESKSRGEMLAAG